MKKRRKQYSAGAIIWIIFKYVSLVFFSFVAVIPIISCVITAFKTEEEYKTTNVMTLPQNWFNFDNFVEAFQRANMGRAFVNSVIVMVCVLIGAIIIGTQLAYVLNRFQFPGNGLIRNLFLFAALLPGVAMQVTVYQIMHDLGFINHLYGYIIMMMGTDVISIYIFIQYMENIPVSLDESAIIDGASYCNMSQAEFIRQAIARATIRPIVTVSPVNDELLSAVGKLIAEYGKIGGNLNQIARALNEYGTPYNTLSVEVRAAISDLAALKFEVLRKVGDAIGNIQAYQL